MVFTDHVKTVTQDKIVPKVVDNILNSNVLIMRLFSNARAWSGEKHKQPIKYRKNTNGGVYDGFDVFDTGRLENRVFLEFDPKGFYQSVVLAGLEISVNHTEAQVLDIIKTQMSSDEQDMIDNLGDQLYGSGGGKNFTGFNAASDDATNVATYGGLARATYTTIKGNLTTGVGALGLDDMAAMYDSCKRGPDRPTIITCPDAVWTSYESLIQPTIATNVNGFAQVTRGGMAQNRAALKGEVGFDALHYRGTPVVADEKAPSGSMNFVNEKHFVFVRLKHWKHGMVTVGEQVSGPQSGLKTPFIWTGLKEPVNQDAEVGQFLLNGDFVSDGPRYLGRLEGIT